MHAHVRADGLVSCGGAVYRFIFLFGVVFARLAAAASWLAPASSDVGAGEG